MGWPFNRQFQTTVEAMIAGLPSAAGRSFSIVHTPLPPIV